MSERISRMGQLDFRPVEIRQRSTKPTVRVQGTSVGASAEIGEAPRSDIRRVSLSLEELPSVAGDLKQSLEARIGT